MSFRMFREKRGISPLIATVLLIAFAVALGAVVMSGGKTVVTTNGIEASACKKAEVKVHEIERPQLSYNRSGNYIDFMIDNVGTVDISGLRIWVIGESKDTMIINIEEEIKQGYPLRKKIDYDFGKYGNIKEIDFIPVLVVDKNEIVCTNNAFKSLSVMEE